MAALLLLLSVTRFEILECERLVGVTVCMEELVLEFDPM